MPDRPIPRRRLLAAAVLPILPPWDGRLTHLQRRDETLRFVGWHIPDRACPWCGLQALAIWQEDNIGQPAEYAQCVRCCARGPYTTPGRGARVWEDDEICEADVL